MLKYISLLVILAGGSTSALGQSTDPVGSLTRELKAHIPLPWQVRVRWRDGNLLASITPLPYDTAFQLWYEPEKLHRMLVDLCPKPTEEIWTLIDANQDVVLEPTVGSKSGVEARVACRSATRSAGAG
jgi:hypothetical protein